LSDSKNVKNDEKHQKLVQDQPLGLYPSPSPCPPTLNHGLWRQKFIRHTCRNHFHLDQSAGFWASKNCSGYPNFKSSLVHIQNYGMETFFWMHTSARSSRRSSWWRGDEGVGFGILNSSGPAAHLIKKRASVLYFGRPATRRRRRSSPHKSNSNHHQQHQQQSKSYKPCQSVAKRASRRVVFR